MQKQLSTLGLTSSATVKDIKKAYRKLVLNYHPDRNKAPNAYEKFLEIDEAYDYLIKVKSGKINPYTFYEAPKPRQKTAEELAKEQRKAAAMFSYFEKLETIERAARLYYVIAVLLGIIGTPMLTVYLGIYLDSGFIIFLSIFVVPGVSIFLFCYLVYQQVEKQKEAAAKEFKLKKKKRNV